MSTYEASTILLDLPGHAVYPSGRVRLAEDIGLVVCDFSDLLMPRHLALELLATAYQSPAFVL